MNILNDIENESKLLREATDRALATRLASVDTDCFSDKFVLHQGKQWLDAGAKSNALARRIGGMALKANNEDALVILELMERLEEK